MKALLIVGALLALSDPADASSPAAWKAADQAMRMACTSAAGLTRPKLSPIILFSDTMGKSALLVTGHWPQPHMKHKSGTMLCLYDRRSKRAEASEAPGWQTPR